MGAVVISNNTDKVKIDIRDDDDSKKNRDVDIKRQQTNKGVIMPVTCNYKYWLIMWIVSALSRSLVLKNTP